MEQQDVLSGMDKEAVAAKIGILEEEMKLAAQELDFERAAKLRDRIYALRGKRSPRQPQGDQKGKGFRRGKKR
ncbi:MAG: UvrB/UvrC motif-containing protein [Christensenellales bacterium]